MECVNADTISKMAVGRRFLTFLNNLTLVNNLRQYLGGETRLAGALLREFRL
jgi:hypothetical protein